jgi:hypothetical protein
MGRESLTSDDHVIFVYLPDLLSWALLPPTGTDKDSQISKMLSILRKARLKDKEMRILML